MRKLSKTACSGKLTNSTTMERRIIQTVIGVEGAGKRLDCYLAARFTYLSRTGWQREIREGKITVNGMNSGDRSRKLQEGDTVSYDGRGIEEPPVDMSYSVLFEDDQLIAVAKSGNLPTHPSGRYFHNTLLMSLRQSMGVELHPLHRLDRETSGVILFSKDSMTTSRFQRALTRARKTYIALVEGHVREKAFDVDIPVGYDPASAIRKKRVASESAAESAFTRIERIAAFEDTTLIRAIPATGRLHQIRVHCAWAGHPIVGDKLYGPDEGRFLRFIRGEREDVPPVFHRTALHSRKYTFEHPATGEIISVKAPLPDDMKQLIASKKAARSWQTL